MPDGSVAGVCVPKAGPCHTGYVCTKWVDSNGVEQAACVDPAQTQVCDPAKDANRCDGNSRHFCNPNNQTTVSATPPGWVSTDDCTKVWATDATCTLKAPATPVCTSPTDVACDPDTYDETCTKRCVAGGLQKGAVRPGGCTGAGTQCVKNTYSGMSIGCVPATATLSTSPFATGFGYVSCASDTVVVIEEYGYDWPTECAAITMGGTTKCFDPPGPSGPQCVEP